MVPSGGNSFHQLSLLSSLVCEMCRVEQDWGGVGSNCSWEEGGEKAGVGVGVSWAGRIKFVRVVLSSTRRCVVETYRICPVNFDPR